MNRSIILVAVSAAFGLAACTTQAAPEAPANPTTTTTVAPPSSTSVVTQQVTETVIKPVQPPAKPVIGSFGYGNLKLGMTKQQALDAKLIGPERIGGPDALCTMHEIVGTQGNVWVSKTTGVITVTFTAAMTADGAGIGATEAKLKAEYTNLRKPGGPNYSYVADADGNPQAEFVFRVEDGKVTDAFLSHRTNNICHN